MTRLPRYHRDPTPHTDWCTRDHRCNLAEHRAADLIAACAGGRAVITRVQVDGREYAEIRARIPLHHTETGARWQLATALRLIDDLLTTVAVRPGVLRQRTARPALVTSTTVRRTA